MEANLSTLAPRQPDLRDAETVRKFSFLRRVLTPRTVFMEIGSSDCELSVRAASYVERVWCVDAQRRVSRPPCNLRWDAMGGVPLESIDVAFSERFAEAADVCRLLAPGGVWFVYGAALPAEAFCHAGFSRVRYFSGRLPVPARLARMSRSATTAAYK